MRNLYEQCLKLTQFAAMEFEEIFQFSQERLKQALETELIENGYAVRKQRGFLYAEGTVPVLLVAHLDTVHRTQPETICYNLYEQCLKLTQFAALEFEEIFQFSY